jgi:L-erythro-3,5-diaminohexanoate dehydrogenase
VGSNGFLVAIDVSLPALDAFRTAALCDTALRVDATQPVEVLQAISAATRGQRCDLVVNCASVANTEMATILSTRDGGTALFFSMTTNFAAATLGAEGVARDIQLIMGNGYSAGHAELTLDLLRSHGALRTLFEARYLRTGTSI